MVRYSCSPSPDTIPHRRLFSPWVSILHDSTPHRYIIIPPFTLAGSMGLSSALEANPALLVVTVVALARAFQKARQTGDYAALVDGQVKGAIGTGNAPAAVSLVGVAGGPADVALLAGLTAGILANKATKKVSIVQLSEAIAANAQMAAQQAKEAGAQLKARSRMKLPLPCPGRRRSPDSPNDPPLSNPG